MFCHKTIIYSVVHARSHQLLHQGIKLCTNVDELIHWWLGQALPRCADRSTWLSQSDCEGTSQKQTEAAVVWHRLQHGSTTSKSCQKMIPAESVWWWQMSLGRQARGDVFTAWGEELLAEWDCCKQRRYDGTVADFQGCAEWGFHS